MFERDRWQEIMNALAKNKIRTILTAFGVFWGIFMLVVMLGSSKGLEHGVTKEFGDFATNSLFIWPEVTNMPYEGFQKGRFWHFNNDDTKAIWDNIPEVSVVAPRIHPPNGAPVFIYGKNTGSFRINGDYPGYNKIDPVTMLEGRFINDNDMKDGRKVVVIGQRIKEMLFDANEKVLGKYIQIKGVYFQVVGVFKSKHTGGWGNQQNESAFMPFTTVQKTYNLGDIVFYYSITSKSDYSVSYVEEKVRKLMAHRHKVNPEDRLAFGSNNIELEFKKMSNLFTGINFLTWFVGTLTLIAGVIGISNIMLVVVKERTKEIGIQRALGAVPSKIIGQIVQESVFLTFISGIIGMVLGIALVEGINVLLMQTGASDGKTMFANPEVNIKAVLTALVLLVISGTLAGMIPARRAIKIKPIDALRAEL
jgi:putative ABC transport system permease protein